MSVLLGLFVVLGLGLCSAQGPAAVEVTLTESGIQYLSSVLLEDIKKNLTTITIPEHEFKEKDITITLRNGKCYDLNFGDFHVVLQAGWGATIAANQMSVKCKGDYEFKGPALFGKGKMEARGTKLSFSANVSLSTLALRPSISVLQSKVTIGTLDLSFSGSASAVILNMLNQILSEHLKKKLAHAGDRGLTAAVEKLNTTLQTMKIEKKLKHVVGSNLTAAVLYGFPYTPTITSDFLSLQLQGYVVDAANPQVPNLPAPILPMPSASAQYLQIALSTYTPLSLFSVYYGAGLLHYIVNSTMIPPPFPKLNTTTLQNMNIAPNISQYFPLNASVRLDIYAAAMMEMQMSADTGVSASVPLLIDVQAQRSDEFSSAFLLSCNFSLNLDVAVGGTPGNETLVGKMSGAQCPVSLTSSSVGTVNVGVFSIMMRYITGQLLQAHVNEKLKEGIPLPTMKGVQLTNSNITFGNGYVLLTTDFILNTTTMHA